MERADGAATCVSCVQFGGDVERLRVSFENGVESRAVAIERSDAVEVGVYGLGGRTRPSWIARASCTAPSSVMSETRLAIVPQARHEA